MSSVPPAILAIGPKTAALTLYARQWVDPATAEDVVQQALVTLWSRRVRPADPVAWAFRAVRNNAMATARASGRRRKHERAAACSKWFDEPPPGQAIDAAAAEAAVRALPEPLREAVVLRLWGDLGFAEVANVTGTSVSTAHGRYTAAIEQLRQAMRPGRPPAAARA